MLAEANLQLKEVFVGELFRRQKSISDRHLAE
jgi:hypothetical protein